MVAKTNCIGIQTFTYNCILSLSFLLTFLTMSTASVESETGDASSRVIEIVASPNNVNYLEAESEYAVNEDVNSKVMSLLESLEYSPSKWSQWHGVVFGKLNLYFSLGYIIHKNIESREMYPVRFTRETEPRFNKRVKIFLKRRSLVFHALTSHVLGKNNTNDENAKAVCLQHSDEEDPIRLLEKLRGVASSTIAVEMADLFEEFGTLRQGSEDDTTYLGRYKQLVTSMDSVPMPNIPQEWKITRLIKGLGQQHSEIQLQLRMSSAETLSHLTAEDIGRLMMASRGAKNNQPPMVMAANANRSRDPWPSKWPDHTRDKRRDSRSRSPQRRQRRDSRDRDRQPKRYSENPGSPRNQQRSGRPNGPRRYNDPTTSVCKFCNQLGHWQDNCTLYKDSKAALANRKPAGMVAALDDPSGLDSDN